MAGFAAVELAQSLSARGDHSGMRPVRQGAETLREIMKKRNRKRSRSDELRREYDLSQLKNGTRGKYNERYRAARISYCFHLMCGRIFPG